MPSNKPGVTDYFQRLTGRFRLANGLLKSPTLTNAHQRRVPLPDAGYGVFGWYSE